ncbi:Pyrrolidone carboxyl peptidase (pyroglutamate aminopeptidase) [Glarea lozoyensis ATCC 20868]|uniref:Pyrrolidone carboxyl peptidase (Pyroglutamate aminopeptidase) n=1 Tax=Glarea lozoyensis (strain ATCC 20868 / MF5171) TaxID=1116229 RepID=S3CIK5_GLAL2|nr:Pyrrolidone carboxyl peptidase (pyroglutamate aminopeptidase) [Glarea lozoyensis ATCC 20868]EPE26302.1 Pyrrolidone carboxyl peptidase (pyroglutamate aminopeptidase) [Glarea lozoyensis ATCC 20868]
MGSQAEETPFDDNEITVLVTGFAETDLRVSEDAGRYLCDYIYYTSLSHLARRGEEKRVVFLHVPVEADETHIKTGVEATIELIRAIVESGMLKRMAEKGREVRTEEEEGMRRVHGVGEGKVEV